MQTLEIIAAVFGFFCVLFYVVRSVWSWPTGLIQVFLYIAVFWQAKLYADMVLHVVYVVLQVYGWWAWAASKRSSAATTPSHQSEDNLGSIVVRRLPLGQLLFSLCMTVVMWGIFVWMLRSWTDAQSPEADSFVAAASLVAQILLAKRYLENWAYWIVIDVLGVWLFWSRSLPATSILYGLFLIMAIIGFASWNRTFKLQG